MVADTKLVAKAVVAADKSGLQCAMRGSSLKT